MDGTDEVSAAFRRAAYGLYGLATINLLGGTILLWAGTQHQAGLFGSLAFFEALIKLALAYYVSRASRMAAITAVVFLGTRAVLDVIMLLNGGVDAVLRLALAALVIVWLRRALRSDQPTSAATRR